MQVAAHKLVLQPAITGDGPLQVGATLRLLDRVPWLQRLPAYVFGVGFRPEHVRSLPDEGTVSRWAAE
jgi:hypothetical protein